MFRAVWSGWLRMRKLEMIFNPPYYFEGESKKFSFLMIIIFRSLVLICLFVANRLFSLFTFESKWEKCGAFHLFLYGAVEHMLRTLANAHLHTPKSWKCGAHIFEWNLNSSQTIWTFIISFCLFVTNETDERETIEQMKWKMCGEHGRVLYIVLDVYIYCLLNKLRGRVKNMRMFNIC